MAAADAQDRLRKAGYVASPLAGLPVSVKDLFDVAGERTLAGSKALDDSPPAAHDAPTIARLRAAGAVLIGRTNMTEFAFSGVGINPHYGTPGNPWDRKRIPGGSSSGAPISVADGMAAVAIGTDTGGSVRIPAAFCGLAGLKPTQSRIPREGATINAKGGFSPCEAYAWHEPHLKRRGTDYDPRVRVRIERGREMTAVDYVRLLDQRADLIARVDREAATVDALIMPTLPLVAPPIAAFSKDEDFWRLNARILRNTAPINFLDRCAITLPISPRGEAPVGLTAVGGRGEERRPPS